MTELRANTKYPFGIVSKNETRTHARTIYLVRHHSILEPQNQVP